MKKISIIAILAVIGFCSCTEDFITKDPLGIASSATYYKDPAQCQLAVNAVYDPLGWFKLHDEFLWKIGDICSDDAERGGGNDKPNYTTGDDWDKGGQLAVFEATDRSTIMTGIWEAAYIAIKRANDILAGTEGLGGEDFKVMRAETRFLRAWYYFQLTKVYGPVVLLTSTVSVADAENLGNRADGDDGVGSKQVRAQYDFIISELEAIKDDLPVKATSFGKVTNGAARAFLAKAYLYRADMCGGATRSDDLKSAYETAYKLYQDENNNTYGLEEHYQNVFYIYGETYEKSKEIVFSIQHIQGSIYGRGSEGSIIPIYFAPRYYTDPNTGAGVLEDQLGYGFGMPTQDLMDEFEDGDPRATMVVASPQKASAAATITRLNLDTKGWCKPNNIVDGSGQNVLGWYDIGSVDWNTGYYCMKRTMASPLIMSSKNTQCMEKNDILLRWADVMLIAAEAGVQCGHAAEATTLLNELRTRANNSARTIDYSVPGSSDACYTYTPSSALTMLGTATLDDVKHERRVEMYGEGERFWDLIRWDETEKFRTQDISGYKFKYNPATLGRWPIPQAQIILHAGGNLKQNPGY